jgi:hypothetical protein
MDEEKKIHPLEYATPIEYAKPAPQRREDSDLPVRILVSIVIGIPAILFTLFCLVLLIQGCNHEISN